MVQGLSFSSVLKIRFERVRPMSTILAFEITIPFFSPEANKKIMTVRESAILWKWTNVKSIHAIISKE